MAVNITDPRFISELQQRYLECSVCTEIFNENDRIPKILPCQHTFCLMCLNAIHSKDELKCPACNCLHILNKHEFIALPKDNTRRDLKSFLQIQETLLQLCSLCKGENSKHVCNTCELCLCSDCCRLHKINFPSHLTVHVDKIKEEECSRQNLCLVSGHDKSPLKYFCNAVSCKTIICANCAILDHRNTDTHDVTELNALFEERKKLLSSAVSSLRKRIEFVKEIAEKCYQQQIALSIEKIEFTERVEFIAERGIQVLNDRTIQILKNYNTLFHPRERILLNSKVQTTTFVENAEECCKLSEQILRSKNIESFLTVDNTMVDRIKEFIGTEFEDIEQDRESRLRLMENEVKKFENILKTLDSKTATLIPENGIELLLLLASSLIKICAHGVRQQAVKFYGFMFAHHGPRRFTAEDFQIFFMVLICMLLFVLRRIPGDVLLPKEYFSDFKFDTIARSQFACRLSDNKTVSSFPNEPGTICGKPNMFFKYKGVFGTKTFFPNQSENLDVTIELTEYYKHNEKLLFEFGLTPIGADGKLLIQEQPLLVAVFYSESIGLCVKIGETCYSLLSYDEDCECTKETFRFQIRPNESSIAFGIQRWIDTFVFHNFTHINYDKPLIPVFAMYDIDKMSVSIMLSDSLQFNRSSLHPHLYISDDNKIVSNKKTCNTTSIDSNENPYVYSAVGSVGSSQHAYTIIEIHFTDSYHKKRDMSLFDFGFGYQTNDSFDKYVSFECNRCDDYKETYCLYTFYRLNHRKIHFQQDLRIIIHYQIDYSIISMFISNAWITESYYTYRFSAFDGRIPQLYIGKHNVDDISVSFTANINMFEAIVLHLSDWKNS